MRTMTLGRALALGAALAIGVGACGGDAATGSEDQADADGPAVTIATFMYEPDPVRARAGEPIAFTNEDDILHTVTAGTRGEPTGGFDENLDGPGSTAEVAIDEPGTYQYFCDVHAGMDGTIEVE